VGGRTEAVETETLRVPCGAERPVPDQPSTEQRRDLRVFAPRRETEAVPLVRDGLLGIAAVQRVAREPRPIAQVLAARPAIAALAAGPPEPRHTHTVADGEPLPAFDDRADDLVSEDERQLRVGGLAVPDVQVGPADPARMDAEAQLPRPDLGMREPPRLERRAVRGAGRTSARNSPLMPESVRWVGIGESPDPHCALSRMPCLPPGATLQA
jgi:hypothetical protein